MIYFIMFQDHLFLFIKLKTIYKFKGPYSPLTQATDNINYKKIILIHTQTIVTYYLKYTFLKIHLLHLPPTQESASVTHLLVTSPFSNTSKPETQYS